MAIPSLDCAADTGERALLNRMNSHAHAVQLGDKLFSTKQSVIGKYDYSVQGGAVGLINLVDAKGGTLKLPADFVITNVIIDRVTSPGALTSGTISLGVNSTADLLAATNNTTFDGTSLLAGIPVGSAATAIKVTADSAVTMTLATTAYTTGKFYVEIEGYQSRSF